MDYLHILGVSCQTLQTYGDPLGWGNITRRSDVTTVLTYIDESLRLPNGIATSFSLYMATAGTVYVQTWRPYPLLNTPYSNFRLVGEKAVTATKPGILKVNLDLTIYG